MPVRGILDAGGAAVIESTILTMVFLGLLGPVGPESQGPGTLRMTLVTPDGRPLPDHVSVWRRKITRRKGLTGHGADVRVASGRLTFSDLGGREQFRIRAAGYVEVVRTVTVNPGEERDLGEIVLDPGVTLRGWIVDEQGAAVPGGIVGFRGYRETKAAYDGRFTLSHVPEGESSSSRTASSSAPCT